MLLPIFNPVWERDMPTDDPKLLRAKAAQCQAFARSARLPDLAEMLLRVAESFHVRAMRAEHARAVDRCVYP
jgi:hypothetical protein